MKTPYVALAGILLLLGLPAGALAAGESYEAEGIYRGTGESGLTGLYYTVSPETLGTGLSVNVYGIVEPTTTGNTVITPASITLGLGENIELSATSRLIAGPTTSGTGDTEFSAKYKFRNMGEVLPAMAIAAGVILPTSSTSALSDVNTLGGRIMVIAGGDAQVGERTVVGMYFNMAVHFFDPGQTAQEKFVSYNFGIMVPIGEDLKLQGFIDTKTVYGKTVATPNYQDGARYMIGLRYAARFLKISAGVETGGSVPARIMGGVAFEI